jgi:hypothetical protein
MPRSRFSSTDLDTLQRQLECWRRSQSGYRRLPEEAWAAACALTRGLGVSRVARSLGLDYYKLKERSCPPLALVPLENSAVPPGFLELHWSNGSNSASPKPGSGSAECRVEFCDPAGGRLSLQAPAGSPVVLGLAQAFWRRPRP